MSKIKFTLCLIAIILANALMLINILRTGSGDFRGEVITGTITLLFLVLIYYGVNWLKWIAGPAYTLLAVGGAVAIVEGDHQSYLAVSVCFALAAWAVFTSKRASNSVPTHGRLATLDEDLFTTEREVQQVDTTQYPVLLTRIKSTFIDNMLILLVLMIVMIVTEDWENTIAIKIILGLTLWLLYEPVLTAYSSTIGQRITGIRVRSVNDINKRINLFQGIVRFLIKLTLGWISFITIHSNRRKQAIHDLIAGSVMIESEANPVMVQDAQ
jgi:uncharacterized RDD family membrane protein YckC